MVERQILFFRANSYTKLCFLAMVWTVLSGVSYCFFGVRIVAEKHWPRHERPRERLLAHGAEVLSDTELLAIFLRTGTAGRTVMELAADLMAHFGNVKNILDADCDSFCQIKGLGKAKYCQLQAATELMNRHHRAQLDRPEGFSSPEAVRRFLRGHFSGRKHEVFSCLFLDNKNRLIACRDLFQGTINGASVYPRVVAEHCLHFNAAAVVFAHNHPSGVCEPSQQDIDITRRLASVLDALDIRVLDHFVIGYNKEFSMVEAGMI